jgi:hypothetical protein
MGYKITPELVSETLLAAREKMNSRGKHWVKGFLRVTRPNGETAYCSVGAIRAAAGRRERLARACLFTLVESIGGGIIEFIDAPSTTWGDVSRAFRKAARDVLKQSA